MPAPATAALYDDIALINGSPIRNVVGDPLSDTLYGYTFNGRLYRSDDSGATWQLVTTNPALDEFIMSPADPAILYSGQGNQCDGPSQPAQPLYTSTDSGVNWHMLPNGADMRPLLLDPDNAEHIFAATCTMLFLSEDGGESWTAKAGNADEQLWQIYQVLAMASGVQPGADAPSGGGWDQLYAGGVARDGSGVVAFSNDLGATWVRLTPNVLPSPWGLNVVAADHAVQGLVAFAEPHGVWQTANFGVDWQVTATGLETVVERKLAGGVFGLNDLVFHPSGNLYLATVRGLYVREASATTWRKITGTTYDNLSISKIIYTAQAPDALWLNTAEGVYLYRVASPG